MIILKKKLTLTQINEKAKQFGLKKSHGRYDSGDLCKKLGLIKEYYLILENNIKFSQPNKAILHLIKRLSQKKKVGIVSNSMRKTINLYLTHYHLKVNFIFSSEDAGCRKDNLNYWKRLVKQHKLNPEECLIIGDNPREDRIIPKILGFKAKLYIR